MEGNKLAPKRRFRGFIEEWKQLYFYDFTKLSQGLQIAIEKRHLTKTKDRMFYITNEFLNPNSEIKYYIETPPKSVVANENDILITRTGNTGLIVTDVSGAFHNNFFKVIYDRSFVKKEFLYYLLNSSEIQREMLGRAGTSTIPDLNHNDFYTILVKIPLIKEQQKIGAFFKVLDERIASQERKVAKIKGLKSAYLTEMFPQEGETVPKRRFKGFEKNWSETSLDKVLDYEQPTNYIVSQGVHNDSYNIPVLTAGQSFILGYTDERYGTKKASTNIPVIIFDDFTTSSHFVDFFFKVKSSALKILIPNSEKYHTYFTYLVLKNIKYLPQSHERHWISIYSKFKVMIPSIEEQQKIGKFFKNLDDQIEMEEKKLDKLQKMKEAYLEEMFV